MVPRYLRQVGSCHILRRHLDPSGLFSVFTGAILLSLVVTIVAGCGSGDTTGANDHSSQAVATSSKSNTVKDQIHNKLVGVWLGGAYLDESILATKIADFPDEEIDDCLRRAQLFAGTVMAIEFKPDGSLENEIEIIPPGGQPQRERGVGTWQVVQIADEGFVVEVAERHDDGSVSKSQRLYKFYEDGDHFAVSIPLDDVLGECNPLIIFERQDLGPQEGVLAEVPRDSTQR